MTTKEFSEAFDVLLNSNAYQPVFGAPESVADIRLDEYEKSEFLTRAQDMIVTQLYNGTYGKSFEETEELTSYLAPLVRQVTIEKKEADVRHIVPGSSIFKLPEELMYRTYESCTLHDEEAFACDGGTVTASVVPVTQDEYWRTSRNPFKGPNRRKVLRLAFDSKTDKAVDKFSELVSEYPVQSYTVRYIKRPQPIVLIDLPDGLTVDGNSKVTECELNPQLHKRILSDAITLAVTTRRAVQPQSQVQHS